MIAVHSRIGVFPGAAALRLCICNQPVVNLKVPASQDSETTIRDWDGIAHAITAQIAAKGLLPAPALPLVVWRRDVDGLLESHHAGRW
jgi:hypothetical protein